MTTPETWAQLERFMLGSDVFPAIDLLRQHKLAAYAYTRLPANAPARKPLHGDFVFASMHHLKVKAALVPLFRAWAAAGLPVLVFKGFFLAEFVYEQACQRPYSDIDLLIKPADVASVSAVAQTLGWQEVWQAGKASDAFAEDFVSHEVLHLEHPHYPLQLDIHVRLVHAVAGHRLQDTLTQLAWQQAVKISWEDTCVYTLATVDALLFGLMLSRSWSADAWQLKAQDYLDFIQFIAAGVTFSELCDRATTLGCQRTLRLFLERCNPFTKTLQLTPPTVCEHFFWELQIIPERGSPALERCWVTFRTSLADAVWAFPSFLLALVFWAFPVKLEQLLKPLAQDSTCPTWQYRRLKRGIRAWLFATGFRWLQSERLAALSLLVSLRRKGVKISLQQGNIWQVYDPT